MFSARYCGLLALPGTAAAVVPDSRLDISGLVNASRLLVVHVDALVIPQVILDLAIALIWAFS